MILYCDFNNQISLFIIKVFKFEIIYNTGYCLI